MKTNSKILASPVLATVLLMSLATGTAIADIYLPNLFPFLWSSITISRRIGGPQTIKALGNGSWPGF
jgi:hypothetical protein